jgi:integrase
MLHFRRAVPPDLRLRLGRHELTRSLRTPHLDTAKLDAARLYVASERLFLSARADPMLTNAQLARLVQDFYDVILERENAMRLRGRPLDDAVVVARESYYGELAARARKSLGANRLGEVRFITEAMLRRQGIATATLAPEAWQQARQAVMRAGIDVAAALQARYAGDFNYKPQDQLLTVRLDALADPPPGSAPQGMQAPPTPEPDPQRVPAEVTPKAGSQLLFSKASGSFLEDQVISRAWEKQSASQARATFRLFVDVCGDKPLCAYTRQEAGRFKEQIQRLPGDYGKAAAYRDLSVSAILELYARQPIDTRSAPISAKTIKRHFSALSSLWKSAEAKGEVSQNIFLGFRYGAAKKAIDQRQMWEQEELARLFATPVWTGCSSERRRHLPGHLILRDEKFWLPLIAVFSGMRQEEICQLYLEDVKREREIWFFDLHARGGRMLKNTTAIRRVPIHEELIRLGLLTQIAALKAQGAMRLFPQLRGGGADGRLGHAYTKWFTRYRQDVGLYREGLDFHSFRHTATTLMHEADVQGAIIDRVTGHVTPGETARYTKRTTLLQLKAAIDGINIGIDLSHLYASTSMQVQETAGSS